MRIYFSALEKVVLLHAQGTERIALPPCTASELEVYLGALMNLEARGFVRRERGSLPLRPFRLTPLGAILRDALAGTWLRPLAGRGGE